MIISLMLIAALGIALYKWAKWRLEATILAAWIAENNYAPPEKQDTERLAKWVVQKSFKS